MKDFWTLDIKFDAKAAEKQFRQLGQEAIPKALAGSVNHLANGVHKDLREKMNKIFKKPNDFTLNMFHVKRATPKNLTARIVTRDFATKGTAAATYLSPQVFGGPRDMKRSEKALSILSGGQYWLPGEDAPLDRWDNIKKSELVKIISRFGLMMDHTANFNSNSDSSKRMRRRKKNALNRRHEYFIARAKDGDHRPTGIYKYSGTPGKVLQILKFVPKQPTYQPIFPAQKIADDYVAANSRRVIKEELEAQTKRIFGGSFGP